MIDEAKIERLTKKFMNALADLCGNKYMPLYDAKTGITGIFDMGRSKAPFYIIPAFNIVNWKREILKTSIAIRDYEKMIIKEA